MKRISNQAMMVGALLVQSAATLALDELPIAYSLVAKVYDVPADILYAVALAESGKAYQGKLIPWPWALNINGNSVYCESQVEAQSAISQAILAEQPIDIGVMQISWRWHQQRFEDSYAALIPIQNLKMGAVILREQFEQTQDWWEAVGRYHDPGQDEISLRKAEQYRTRVKKHWQGVF